jgi:uncharacterized protein (DUF2141 family)
MRLYLLLLMSLTNALPSLALAATDAALNVQVIALRNSRGHEICTIYDENGAKGFPEDGSKSLRTVIVPIRAESATCTFPGLPSGRYAIVTFHDENGNGQFDRDSLGLPLEQYGFSNSLKPKFARPTFKQAAFHYDGGDQWMTIRLAN